MELANKQNLHCGPSVITIYRFLLRQFSSPRIILEKFLYRNPKSILLKEPPQSYLFRKLNNGSVTLVTISDTILGNKLYEVEIKNCNCEGILLPIQRFKSLEDFIEYCNFVCSGGMDWKDQRKFMLPVTRKNPLSLEEMAKSCVVAHYANSIDQLNLPKRIKENLEHHNHFEIIFDEKEVSKKIALNNDFLDKFHFRIGSDLRSCSYITFIIDWKKWAAWDFSSGMRKLYSRHDLIPRVTLLDS